MFGITTSHDFLAKLKDDFADYEKDPGSARLALNCAMTAHHLHEWVWWDWLEKYESTRKALQIHDLDGFRDWLSNACPWLFWMRQLANGTKHFRRRAPFQALKVSAMPAMPDTPGAGWDEGVWDGPMPFTTGDPVFLLIDNGPDAAEHRWMPFGMLLDGVVRFWLAFFERYAPPLPADTTGP